MPLLVLCGVKCWGRGWPALSTQTEQAAWSAAAAARARLGFGIPSVENSWYWLFSSHSVVADRSSHVHLEADLDVARCTPASCAFASRGVAMAIKGVATCGSVGNGTNLWKSCICTGGISWCCCDFSARHIGSPRTGARMCEILCIYVCMWIYIYIHIYICIYLSVCV